MTIPGAVGIHFILSFIQSSSNPFLRMTIFLPFSRHLYWSTYVYWRFYAIQKRKEIQKKKYVSVLKLTKPIFGESLTMVVYRVSKKFFFSLLYTLSYSVCHVHFIRALRVSCDVVFFSRILSQFTFVLTLFAISFVRIHSEWVKRITLVHLITCITYFNTVQSWQKELQMSK